MPQEALYVNLRWRLEVPTATRRQLAGSDADVRPLYSLCFIGEDPATGQEVRKWMSCDYETLHNICKSVEDAVASLRSPQYRRINKIVK
jgi:hypothetical protein